MQMPKMDGVGKGRLGAPRRGSGAGLGAALLLVSACSSGYQPLPTTTPRGARERESGGAQQGGDAGAPQVHSADLPSADSHPPPFRRAQPPSGVVRAVGDHLERDGQPFVFQGVNGPAPWGAHYKEEYTRSLASLRFEGISKMAELGANTMRIVHFDHPPGKLPAAINLNDAVTEVMGYGMVPVLGVWDRTCKTSPSEEIEAFWLSGQGAALAEAYPQLVINPYNELNFEDEEKHTTHRAWADYYIDFVQRLRAAGLSNLVMIDSGGKCAQNPEGIAELGEEIVEADPLHNVVFSVHLYAFWESEGKLSRWPEGQWRIQDWIAKLGAAPFPVVFGEFGGPNPKIQADYQLEAVLGACDDGMDGRFFWMDFDGDYKPFYNVYTDLTWSALTPVGKRIAKWLSLPCTPSSQ